MLEVTQPLATSCFSSLLPRTNVAEVMLEVGAGFELGGDLAGSAKLFSWKGMGRRGMEIAHSLQPSRKSATPPHKGLPSPNPQISFHKVLYFVLLFFVLKNINRHNIKNTNIISRGTAENTWVPPEGQHQGLHGPPTFPTLEQLRVWTTHFCLCLRPSSSSHLRRRWERELPLPINKVQFATLAEQDSGTAETWRDHFSSLVQRKKRFLTRGGR